MSQSSDSEEAPPRFAIWSLAWVFSGFYAICVVIVSVKTGALSDAFRLGQALGAVVATLVIPTLMAWLVWRMTRHSSAAANVTFFIVFGLIAIAQIAEFGRRTRQQQVLAKVLKEQRDMVAEQHEAFVETGKFDAASGNRMISQAKSQMGELASASSGDDKRLAETARDYLAELQAAKSRYDNALKVLTSAQVLDLSKFTTGPASGEKRTAVEAFRKANADLLGYQDAEGAGFARYLKTHGLTSDQIANAVGGYKKSAGERIVYAAKMRDCDDQLAQAMLDFLSLAEKNYGQWHFEASTNKLTFRTQEAAKAYNEVMARVKSISQQETQYQKQILAR